MGGLGSGKWYRWCSRVTVGAGRKPDVRARQRKKVLTPGNVVSWAWRRDGEPVADIRIWVRSDAITLTSRCRSGGGDWEDVTEPIPLDWAACSYGGRRPWFRCPGVVGGRHCGRRCAVLYQAATYFLCRTCYDLADISQDETWMDGCLRRAQDIRMRLGGTGSLADPFPPKPKGMHRRTYLRLVDEADRAETIYDNALLAEIVRFDRRIATKYAELPTRGEAPGSTPRSPGRG